MKGRWWWLALPLNIQFDFLTESRQGSQMSGIPLFDSFNYVDIVGNSQNVTKS